MEKKPPQINIPSAAEIKDPQVKRAFQELEAALRRLVDWFIRELP